ncbi:hypothetical protein PG987_009140 [Apiospora arundinis]|uniref:Siderophore biosynthesis n=1 Tax=Apiospora arundinis TaxID=335852 RepID=A0ABR2I0S2_9PEZI
MKSTLYLVPALAYLAGSASAVCHNISFTTCEDGIVHHYDTETGEICDARPCGGGRAPLRTDVPGCPAYKGTSTWPTSASYLSCWKGKSSSLVPASATGATTTAATATPPTSTQILTSTKDYTSMGVASTSSVPWTTVSTHTTTMADKATGVASTSVPGGNAPATTEPPSPSGGQSGGQGSPSSASDAAKPQNAAATSQSSFLVIIGAFVAGLAVLA